MFNSDQILSRLKDIENKLEEFQKKWENWHIQQISGLHNHLNEIEKKILQSRRGGKLSYTIFERLDQLEEKIDKINKD